MARLKQTDQKTTSILRSETIVVALILLVGCLLRVLFLSDSGIEHFDEGVYASNLWFSAEQGGAYPGRHFYAPPLFPFLIEWSMIFLGSGVWGVFLPSLFLGILTVLLTWWVARAWFGPAAGLVAVTLASLSDLHLLYSRVALTDVGLGFCLLLAVYLTWKSFIADDWKWPVLAGIVTGAGWSIKYNGWLPLAVGLSGLIPWLLFRRRQLLQPARYFLRWLVIAIVAFLVWSPVLIGLQKSGGYSVVAANHSRYVVGFSGWFDSFWRQWENHRMLEGTSGFFSLGVVCLALCLVSVRWKMSKSGTQSSGVTDNQIPGSTWNLILSGLIAAIPILLAAFVGISPVLGLLASVGILLQLFFASGVFRLALSTEQSQVTESELNRELAVWLLAAWFCGLLLATPLYYPYPRLTIPWTMAAWLGTAAFAGWLEQRAGGSLFDLLSSSESDQNRFRFTPAVGVVTVAVLLVVVFKPWTMVAWQPRNDLEAIAQNILADLRSQSDVRSENAILYTYAEPALFFNIQSQGHPLTGPVADLEFLNSLSAQNPAYLIVGPHAATDPDFQKQFAAVRDRFELVHSYDYSPSLLVRLNQSSPVDVSETEPVLLYRAR
ncbi:glycosyltransferase family 39 protein [Gimesia algae]|uniref:Dolichyl-phosphate-mannose-protein mannosyltransferase n=1 Tax=Gimesia algae TaxID=2527971 RepID=A0A517VL69_9PLAN|nr:glycosyltransferase family 39 protein [Gimesia algae]QDT93756.1 Dolichyl-phosphate-mannose-protein mannosyltransferase [Gimesia algae]